MPKSEPKAGRRRKPRSLTAVLVEPGRGRSAPGEASPEWDRPGSPEREDLHRLACEAGRTGSWYVRLDTQQCTLSPMAAALLGLPPRETNIPADHWRKRVDPDHMAGLDAVVGASLRDDAPFGFEFRATRTDGTEYWLYVRGGVLRDATGEPVRIHGAVVDVTEQKRAKDALRRLNETLELRVAERTRELVDAQEKLRQSQKLEAMGQLTGGIAHDFNNLLTPIVGNLDLLAKKARGPRDKRLIDGALKSAESAGTLVQRLLAFARRQALQRTCVDVAGLLTGMGDLIARTIGPRIRIEHDLAADLKAAFADANQLELAILNLSVNARDAMPDGGILTISAANRIVDSDGPVEPGDYVRLAIADTGTGMDEETLARAVEPFFSTKHSGEGTGLGLSMVHGLASQMRGMFRLSSRQGAGTIAELWLPAWTGPAEAAEPPPGAGAGAQPQATGTVLLVDDHQLVRASTAEMLSELGYRVIEAESGEQAAGLVERGLDFDLMVTDHLMGGMTGVDLACFVRDRFPAMPVLLVSGYSDPSGIPTELPCLRKPFRTAALSQAIARLPGGEGSGAAHAVPPAAPIAPSARSRPGG